MNSLSMLEVLNFKVDHPKILGNTISLLSVPNPNLSKAQI